MPSRNQSGISKDTSYGSRQSEQFSIGGGSRGITSIAFSKRASFESALSTIHLAFMVCRNISNLDKSMCSWSYQPTSRGRQ